MVFDLQPGNIPHMSRRTEDLALTKSVAPRASRLQGKGELTFHADVTTLCKLASRSQGPNPLLQELPCLASGMRHSRQKLVAFPAMAIPRSCIQAAVSAMTDAGIGQSAPAQCVGQTSTIGLIR